MIAASWRIKIITKLCTPMAPTLLSFIASILLDGPAARPSAVSIKPSRWSPPVMRMLIAIDIKATEISGQLKYLNKSQENDCKKPIKTPIKGAKRTILLNVGLIIGHWGKIV